MDISIRTHDIGDWAEYPGGIICLDIETTGLDPEADQVGCLTMYWPGYDKVEILSFVGMNKPPENLKNYLREADAFFHFYGFDGMFLYKKWGIEIPHIRDTKLLAQILGCENTTLRSLLTEYVSGWPLLPPKTEKDRIKNWCLHPDNWTEDMKEYVISDVQYLYALHSLLLSHAPQEGRDFYLNLCSLYPELVKVKNLGFTNLGQLNFLFNYSTGPAPDEIRDLVSEKTGV